MSQRRDEVDREIDEELRFHVEERIDALVSEGVPRDEARARVVAAFGDVGRIREEMRGIEAERARRERLRDGWSGWRSDVRVAVRRLRGSPTHTLSAVVTLALGIGATVAMFTVLDAVAMRPLPYAEADRLVRVWPGRTFNISLSREVGAAVASLRSFTGMSRWELTLTGHGDATVLDAEVVDAGYFDTFGVRPVLGRAFRPEETEPSSSGVVLLGHDLWRTRFGGDAGVIGRRIRLDGYAHETRQVIGVMPADRRAPGERADVWIPLHLAPGRDVATDSSWYVNQLIARMVPGVPVARVSQEVRAAAERMRERYPGRVPEEALATAGASRLLDALVGEVRGTLWLLLGAVAFVLLIACANLANLQLARALDRRRDLAVRAAIGAGRARLVREQLVESTVLAAAGSLLGLGLAHVALSALRVAEASGLPRAGDLSLDARALAFTIVLCALSVLLFGLWPALRAASVAPHDALQQGGRARTASREAHRVGRALVAIEIALSMVLVTAAAHMLVGYAALRSVDPGADTRDVLAVRLSPATRTYQDERAIQLYRDLLERIRRLPGVSAAGAIQLEPFNQGNWSFPYLAEGHAPPPDEPLPATNFRVVTPGYFQALDIPLLAGRDLSDADRAGAERVLVLNSAMADELWPGEDPLGKQILIFGSESFRVVGLVGDVHQHALDFEPQPEMYVAHAQWSVVSMAVMIEAPRALSLAPIVRDVVRELDADIPVPEIRPLDRLLGESMERRRFFAGLIGAFGALALALGAVGVYGVMAHLVGSRLPDYGVRLALGASPAAVARRALWSGLAPALLGLAAGCAASVASAGLLRGLLFGVPTVHPPTYAAVAATLLAVAAAASWLPARRAASADPVAMLRSN